jgi:O-antigen/teichoic acid export membrane protein
MTLPYSLLERPAILSVLRIAGAGAGFLAQMILAWVVKPEQLGVFYSATSLAMVAGIISAQGYQQIAARFAARYREPGKRHLFKLFVGRSLSDACRLALIVAGAIVAGAFLLPGLDAGDRWSFAICGAMVLPLTILTIYTNLAGAIKHFGLCYVPEGLFRPFVFLIVLGGSLLLGVKLSDVAAAALIASITFAIAGVVHILMRGVLPKWQPAFWRADRLAKRWRREAWPLILLSLFTNYFVDIAIICATPFLSSADVAVFGLCMKLAMLAGYMVQIAQQMVVPDLADARRNSDTVAVESILRRAMIVPAVATAGAVAVVAVFGKLLLTAFGPGFAAGQFALLLIVFSQFVRAIAGPSAHLITLVGAQRLNASLSAAAIGVLLLSNLVLVPLFHLAGAGLAVLATYGLWLIAVACALHRLGEFRTDFFAVLRPRSAAYAAKIPSAAVG